MIINDLMDLIKKLFGNDYENVIIVDGDRTEHGADEMEWNELHKEHKNILEEGFTLRVEE